MLERHSSNYFNFYYRNTIIDLYGMAVMEKKNIPTKLANIYYQSKKYNKIKKELKSMLKKHPEDAGSHFKLGVVYGNEGLMEESLHEFEKTIEYDPTYSKAYYNLGALYSSKNDGDSIETAIQHFNKYLELEPDTKYRKLIEQWKKHCFARKRS
jgi:tetratricopeptide (TPR) repeat protein